ncbi:MAG: TRAP transporter large permease subunit [Rhodobacteraceae bacterium]|nr:TRAP transporter large permease subunit [Paracoccaceae bacterium]
MSYEMIAILMFSSMMLMLLTGQRVFGAIGGIAAIAAIALWGTGGGDVPFSASMKLMKWYPLLTLPMFIFMGYILSESRIADDLYRMFHVWMGPMPGGLAIGTILLMVLISAMNGLSVAGMAIGATIALPELLKRGYDKRMVTGVIQAGSSLGILVPPSVVLVLYAMIARAPVGQLWLAGVIPGLVMAAMFIIYIAIRCKFQPSLGPALSAEEREVSKNEKFQLLLAGTLPIFIFAAMMVPFVNGWTSLVESSAIGAGTALLAAIAKRRLTLDILISCLKQTLGISCMFMWIILAALGFGSVFDGLGAVKAIESLFTEQLGLSPWMILVLMQLSFLVMGTFLDDTAMLVIVAPLYVPLVGTLDLGMPRNEVLIWYGVLYTITTQIAYMTPPFGYNLFLMRAMAPKEITMKDIYASITPFVAVMVLALIIVMIFPQLALWLPSTVYGR